MSFTQQQQQQQQEKPDSVGEHQHVINNGGQITPASSVPPSLSFGDVQQAQKEGESETPPPDPGRLVIRETGMRYIDGAHWTAILEEVRAVLSSNWGVRLGGR